VVDGHNLLHNWVARPSEEGTTYKVARTFTGPESGPGVGLSDMCRLRSTEGARNTPESESYLRACKAVHDGAYMLFQA